MIIKFQCLSIQSPNYLINKKKCDKTGVTTNNSNLPQPRPLSPGQGLLGRHLFGTLLHFCALPPLVDQKNSVKPLAGLFITSPMGEHMHETNKKLVLMHIKLLHPAHNSHNSTVYLYNSLTPGQELQDGGLRLFLCCL